MPVSYKEISKKVGYTGYLAYPSLQDAQMLSERLCTQPTIKDFEYALSLYRFTPEATCSDQIRIIEILQVGLSFARNSLFIEEEKSSLMETVLDYWQRFLPAPLNSFSNPK